jgi:hypothetical protein
VSGDAPTLEEVQEHLDEIRAAGDLVLPASLTDEIELARPIV